MMNQTDGQSRETQTGRADGQTEATVNIILQFIWVNINKKIQILLS